MTGRQGKGLHVVGGILFFETQNGAGTLQEDYFSYRTIGRAAEGLYKDKGSRFLAFAYPVTSESEISAHIRLLQKKYFDARHHCYAWMLGPDRKLSRAFDDGEPNHSAGDPILGQIRSRSLTDVLVVVVRYFGGVKLGVGGLIAAYKNAAEDALNNAELVEKHVMRSIRIHYDYPATADVMRLVREYSLEIRSQTFEAACELTADVRLRDELKLVEKLDLLKATGVNVRYYHDQS